METQLHYSYAHTDKKNRNDPISVMLLKAAKASTIVTVMCHYHVLLLLALSC
jgi:hypothetical protein